MKSKPAVGMVVLLAVGLITWSITTTIAAGVMGGREEFLDWRSENTSLFFGIWFAEIVVIGLPALWFAGRRMTAYSEQQDKAAVEARGVGNLAAGALRGDKKAIARLEKLLDDGSPAVRYQCARALALLDDKETEEELFRKVRYWDGNLKLGLIDTLRRTMDVRTVKILRMLSADRNPMVARKARTALGIVTSRSGSIDDLVAKRRKQAQAKKAKAERKKAKQAGTAEGEAEPAAKAEASATVETPATVGTPAKAGTPARIETPAKVETPASVEPPD